MLPYKGSKRLVFLPILSNNWGVWLFKLVDEPAKSLWCSYIVERHVRIKLLPVYKRIETWVMIHSYLGAFF